MANINISQNNFDGKILIQVLVIHGLVTLNERFNQKNLKYLGLTWQKNQLWPYPFDILFCSSLSKLSCYNKGYGCDFNEKLQFAYKEQYFASQLSKFCLLVRYVSIQSSLWLWLKVFWPIWRRLSKSPFAKSRSESAKLSKTELLLFHFTDFYRMWIELT